MVTINEYYDIFRKHAANKSDKNFTEQALQVGYTQQEIDTVVKVVAPTIPPQISKPVVVANPVVIQVKSESTLQKVQQNSVTATPIIENKIPPKLQSSPLPPLLVKPSSYVNRNQIGTNATPVATPVLKSYSYSPINTSKPVVTQKPVPIAVQSSTPVYTSIPNLPGAMPVNEPIPVKQEVPAVQTASTVTAEIDSMDKKPKINELSVDQAKSAVPDFPKTAFTPGSSVNLTNQARTTSISQQKVVMPIVTMNNQAPTDAARVITRSPMQGSQVSNADSRGKGGSWLKVILIILILAIVGLAGILFISKKSTNIKQTVSNVVKDKAPYENVNLFSGVLDKLLDQNNIPYLASAVLSMNDKATKSSFVPSAYQPNVAFSRDAKRVEDINKIKDLLSKSFTAKKKYPKTLKEVGFAAVDPAGKAYLYVANANLSGYKLVIDFETDEMVNNTMTSLPSVTVSTSTKNKVTITQTDTGLIKITKMPFDDTWNNLLSFPSKIDSLPKMLSLGFNVNGDLSRAASPSNDNQILTKGSLQFNLVSKPVNLQIVNHAGKTNIKGPYLDKWVVLDRQIATPDTIKLIAETIKYLAAQNVLTAANPVSEKVTLSNQLSLSAFRYDFSVKSMQLDSIISGLKDELVKGNLIDADIAEKLSFIAAHKDTRALGVYASDTAKGRIWVNQAGEPLKFEITVNNISGRTSNQYLKASLVIEFGQRNPGYVFSIPNELLSNSTAAIQGASSSPVVVKFDDMLKDKTFIDQRSVNGRFGLLNLFIPVKEIIDSVNKLKQSEVDSRTTGANNRSGYSTSSGPGNVGLMPPPAPVQNTADNTTGGTGSKLNPLNELMKIQASTTGNTSK